MKKKIVILTIIFSLANLFGANNVSYLRESGGDWKIGIIKGGNLSVLDEYSVFSSSNTPVLNPNSEFLFCEGDFDGDNRSDVAIVYQLSIGTFHLKVIELERLGEQNPEMVDINLSNDISDLSLIKFIDAGDFDNDGNDEIVLTYEHINSVHTSCRTIDVKNNLISGRYDLTNNKTVLFTSTGDFDKDKKDELCVIFEDGNYQKYITINCSYNDLNGPWQAPISGITELVNKTTMGDINFVDSGDYNGDGQDELVYIYLGNGIYKTQTFDVGNLSWGPIIANEYQLFSKDNEGTILKINTSDLNGNGKDELNIILENFFTDGRFYTINAGSDNNRIISGPHSITNSAMGKVYASVTGDFNGDGLSELCYYYKKPGETRFKNKILNAVSAGADEIFGEIELINAHTNQKFDFVSAIVVNSTSSFDAKENDKDFIPIPVTPGASENDFLIGWYATNTESYINSDFNSNSANTFLRGLGNVDDWSGLNGQIYDLLGENKSAFVDLRFLGFDISSVGNELNQLNKINGYYIGDDFDINNSYDTLEVIYDYMIVNYPSKYTYAAETGQRILKAYNKYSGLRVPFHVPMQFEYIYMRTDKFYTHKDPTLGDNWESYSGVPNYTSFKQTELIKKIQKISRQVKDNTNPGQPGFIYIAQAHDQILSAQWHIRNATFFESRYEIFSSIISGAGGLFFWAYEHSNETNISNLNHLTDEITNGSVLPQSKSIHSALMNGFVSGAEVFSSFDGYDRDADLEYGIPQSNMYYKDRFIGNGIDDLQYILREDGGTYYLISVNTSPNLLKNVKFYCSGNIPSGIIEIEKLSNGNWNTKSYSFNGTTSKDGDTYNKFEVASYLPYEVKIFRFGSGPVLNKEKLFNSKIEVPKNYELNPVYPNPFNPETNIKFELFKEAKVNVWIYNSLGQLIKKLIDNKNLKRGKHQYNWNSLNLNGKKVPSGIYFIKISIGEQTSTQKVVLLK